MLLRSSGLMRRGIFLRRFDPLPGIDRCVLVGMGDGIGSGLRMGESGGDVGLGWFVGLMFAP